MADDKLKIVATLDDQITGPLTKVEGALKRTADGTKGAAVSMRKEWDAFKGVLGQTNSALSTFAAPLAALGIAGGGAALSLGALGGALRGFSQNTQQLDILSKQTGITVKTLQALESMGERVGISGQTMLGAADNFSRAATKLKRGWGEAMMELPGMNLTWLLNDLKSAGSVEEMMDKLFEALPKISNLEARRRVLTIFFGTDEIDKIIQEYGDQAGKKLQEIRKSVADITPEARQAAKEFEDMVGRWNTAVDKAKIWGLTPLLKGIVTLFEDVEKNGLRGNEDQQALRNQLSPFGGPDATPREKLEGRRAQVQQQLDLLEQGPRGADYQRKHDRMVEELKRVGDELQRLREQGATAQPSSFDAPGGIGAMIQKASFGGGPAVGMPRPFGGAGIYGGPASDGDAGGGAGVSPRAPVPHREQIQRSAPEVGEGLRGQPFRSKGALDGARGPIGGKPFSGKLDLRDADWRVVDYIREAARRRGIDPDTALAVADGEGLRGFSPDKAVRGDDGTSHGPFQLHYAGGRGRNRQPGLGDDFTSATGLDARDPKTWKDQVDFALDNATKRGWRAFYGRQHHHVGQWDGIGGRPGVALGENGPLSRSGANVPPVDGVGGVDQQQGGARYRKQAITDELRSQIAAAAREAGVNAEIYSGGQDEGGPNHHGSHRHDHGRSADLKLYTLGPNGERRYLNMNSPEQQAVMEKFIRGTVRHGATGVGAGPGYMGPDGIHIGGGTPNAWGAGGRSANAPDWVRRAHRDGMADRAAGLGREDGTKEAKRTEPAPDLGDGIRGRPFKSKAEGDDADELMRRYYRRPKEGEPGAPGAPGTSGKGLLHIKLEGAPPGTKVNHDMDGLGFRDVTFSRHRAPQMSNL